MVTISLFGPSIVSSQLMQMFGLALFTAGVVRSAGSLSFGSPRSLAVDVAQRRQKQKKKKEGCSAGTSSATLAA